jgi:hypothetical protein
MINHEANPNADYLEGRFARSRARLGVFNLVAKGENPQAGKDYYLSQRHIIVPSSVINHADRMGQDPEQAITNEAIRRFNADTRIARNHATGIKIGDTKRTLETLINEEKGELARTIVELKKANRPLPL